MTHTTLLCILDGWGPGGGRRQLINGGARRPLNKGQPGREHAS